MEFLEKRANISVSQNDKSYDEILSSFQQLPIETKSITGFEIATFVLQCVDLIIAFVTFGRFESKYSLELREGSSRTS